MVVPRFILFWGIDEHTDMNALKNLSSSIDKVAFKSNSMSVGIVFLEEKLSMQTPQSDTMSVD